jgi:hypothetical protein
MNKIRYALLIGINYKNTDFPLSGCWNDVDEINKFLLSKNFINIIMKDDDPLISDLYPTKDNITKQFQNILAKSPDHIFLYFSGHGGQLFDFNKDEKDKKDECIWVYNSSNQVISFSDDQMREIFVDKLESKTFLTSVFDSCHSESILDLELRYKFMKNKPLFDIITKKKSLKNVISISGCQDHDYSGETIINGKVRGILTFYLLKTLNEYKSSFPIENIFRSVCQQIKSSKLSLQVPQFCLTKPILRTNNLL